MRYDVNVHLIQYVYHVSVVAAIVRFDDDKQVLAENYVPDT